MYSPAQVRQPSSAQAGRQGQFDLGCPRRKDSCLRPTGRCYFPDIDMSAIFLKLKRWLK